MNNKEYWDKRTNMLSSITNKSIKVTENKMQKYYLNTYNSIESDMAKLFAEFQSMVDKGIEPTVGRIYRMDRYWQLRIKIEEKCKELNIKCDTQLENSLIAQYSEIYKHAGYKMGFVEKNFIKVNDNFVKRAVNIGWCADGKGFSQRIWEGNISNLPTLLDDKLVTGLMQGKSYRDITKDMQTVMNVSYNQMNRLVRTESAHIETIASLERYKRAGITSVEILHGEDCCDECAEFEGHIYDIKEAEGMIPAHPNCRCSVSPVLEDEEYEAKV